jgi:hypothetical protein
MFALFNAKLNRVSGIKTTGGAGMPEKILHWFLSAEIAHVLNICAMGCVSEGERVLE